MERRTILFVDQVGSTRKLAELGDEAMVAVRNRLWTVINAAAAARGGRVFSEEGDGGAIVFDSVDDGTVAALDMLRRAAESNLEIRIGIHEGAIVANGPGYVGLAVHLAARLCEAAPSGHVMASEALACGLTSGVACVTDFGQRGLKGFTDPVSVVLLTPMDGDPPRVVAAATIAFSPLTSSPLLERSRRQMVGRDTELATVLEALARDGRREARLVTIGGDPGAGKTTVAYAACSKLLDEGALCLIGRADEDSDDPSHELIEMLSPLVAQAPLALLADHVLRHGNLLTRLLPGLGDRVPSAVRPHGGDERQPDRRRLFEAIADLVRVVSATQPIVLLLEDAHWGTGPTLDLIRHLLRAPDLPGVSLIVTYRTTDVEPGSKVASFLQLVSSEPNRTDVVLGALDAASIRQLVVGQFPSLVVDEPDVLAAVADRVERQAGGNALLCVELLGALADRQISPVDLTDQDLPLPTSVQDITYRRVDRLGVDAASVLTDASVLGENFSLGALRRVVGVDTDALAVLDRAEAAGLVRPSTADGREFSFAHAVVQRALYARMRTGERLRRHRTVADVVMASPNARAADVLLHLQRAGALANRSEILRYASDAADDATERLALDEAMRFRQIAVDALDGAVDDGAPSSPIDHALALAALGRAQTALGLVAGKSSMIRAAESARSAGDWQLVGEIATQYGGELKENQAAFGLSEPIELISEALEHHPDATPLRARLLTSLALWKRQSVPYADRRPLIDEALEIARSCDDQRTLVAVLAEVHRSLHGPNVVHEALEHAAELVQLAAELGDDGALFQALNIRLLVSAELGRTDEVRRAGEQLEQVVDRLRHIEGRRITLMLRTLDASIRGDYGDVPRLTAQLRDLLVDYPASDLDRFEFSLRLSDAWLQGHAGPLYGLVAARSPRESTLAWLAADSGQLDLIDDHVTASGGVDVLEERLDYLWWHDVVALTRAARGSGDVALARRIAGAVLPYRDHNAMMGLVAFLGAAEHHLGTLAAICGDHDEAVVHFDAALERHRAMSARPFVAMTQVELAASLRARGADGDGERSAVLIREATAIADELRLGHVQRGIALLS